MNPFLQQGTQRVNLPPETKSVQVSCLNDEDASQVLSDISKKAASVLGSLELEGCSLLAPVAAQVPVANLRLSATSFNGELLSHFPLLRAVNLSGNALRARDIGEGLLCGRGHLELQVRTETTRVSYSLAGSTRVNLIIESFSLSCTG